MRPATLACSAWSSENNHNLRALLPRAVCRACAASTRWPITSMHACSEVGSFFHVMDAMGSSASAERSFHCCTAKTPTRSAASLSRTTTAGGSPASNIAPLVVLRWTTGCGRQRVSQSIELVGPHLVMLRSYLLATASPIRFGCALGRWSNNAHIFVT